METVCFLILLMAVHGTVSVCPVDMAGMDAKKEVMMNCVKPLDDAMTTQNESATICTKLEEAVTCVFSNLDDCGEVAKHFIKPHMMTWIMSAQALGCTPFNIEDVTFGFDTENGANCSFFGFYSCNKKVFDNLGISPASKASQTVPVIKFQKWIMLHSMILDDQEETCKVFADLDAKAMYDCTDKLEKECSPLSRPMTPDAEDEDDEDDDKMDEHDEPKNGTSGEQDGNDGDDEKDDDKKDDDMNMPSKKAAPFSAMFVHQMALSCGDACSGISDKKKAAFETCAASDAVANSEEKTVDALVAAIVAAEGKEDKIEALKTMCEVMKSFVTCVEDAVGECEPLGDDVRGEDFLGKPDHLKAFGICELDLSNVGKPTSAAGIQSISVGLLVTLLALITL